MADRTFDYVVVGAGAAGSILASRLSENPDVTVCVLEAGPSDLRPWVHVPAGFVKTLQQKEITWQFKTEPTENTGGRAISTTQGRLLGGSGSINGMIYNRGQPGDYDQWAQNGNKGWSYPDILPYFKKSERRIGKGAEHIHGRDGAIPVTDLDWIHPISERFIAAAEQQGWPRNSDYNDGEQEGVGYFQRTINRGFRVSSAAAYLRPAMKRPNLEVITSATTSRVNFDGKRASGITYVRGGESITIDARREVVLCAGAVNTPRLLQVSGVGPESVLSSIGVTPVHVLAGVGEHLMDHYSARMVMRARQGQITLNELAKGPRLLGQIARWLIGRPNILSQVPSQIFLFTKSRPELDFPDIQGVFTPGSFKAGKHYVLDDYPGVTAGAWQHRPLSKGHVRAQSVDINVDPVVQPNYLRERTDQQVMVAGMKQIRDVLHSPLLAEFLDTETVPGAKVQSDEEWLDYCRQNGSTAYHLCGSAKMGPANDPGAVVDDQLRVHGLGNLRIADASIMPNIPSANTYAATMMIAEKASDLIAKRDR